MEITKLSTAIHDIYYQQPAVLEEKKFHSCGKISDWTHRLYSKLCVANNLVAHFACGEKMRNIMYEHYPAMCEKGNSSVPSTFLILNHVGQYWTRAIWADRHLVAPICISSKTKKCSWIGLDGCWPWRTKNIIEPNFTSNHTLINPLQFVKRLKITSFVFCILKSLEGMAGIFNACKNCVNPD